MTRVNELSEEFAQYYNAATHKTQRRLSTNIACISSAKTSTIDYKQQISHLMMQLLIKYGNIVLTTTTGRPVRYHSCLLLLVRQAGYIVNLSEFYSYRLIGKLTAFLQLQEFSLRRHTQVASSPSVARLSSRSYRAK
jgi:hypothetical protein